MRSDVHRLPARQARGFTLLELMVTVVLVSILATVAVASYTKWSMRARSEEAVMFLTDLKQQQETMLLEIQRISSPVGPAAAAPSPRALARRQRRPSARTHPGLAAAVRPLRSASWQANRPTVVATAA